MTLAEKLVDLHRALSRARLPHAFGGAIALAYVTRDPRGTNDIDVNIFIPAEEAERALAALPEGVDQPPGTAETIAREGQIRLWWDRTPLDLFFNYAPVHDDAAVNRRTVPFEGIKIPVLGPRGIQPVTYSPVTCCSPSITLPATFGIVPARSSKGISGIGIPL